MSDLENDPEEIPMEEVLAEIRRMLSEKEPAADRMVDFVTASQVVLEPGNTAAPVDDCFILTPDMRCDLPSVFSAIPPASVPSSSAHRPADILTRIQQKTTATGTVSPDTIAWLEANLPRLIDEALARHFPH